MAGLIRCFIAIDFPQEVVEEIKRVQEVIEGRWKFTGKMIEEENLHLTLKFLGEIEESKVESVKDKLGETKFKSFESHLEKLGCFSYRGNPRIVGDKVCGKDIFELQKKIDSALVKEGFKPEERFMSHLTLARVKYVKDGKSFAEYVQKIKCKEVKFKVDRFYLLKSELTPIGPDYEVIETYFLENG